MCSPPPPHSKCTTALTAPLHKHTQHTETLQYFQSPTGQCAACIYSPVCLSSYAFSLILRLRKAQGSGLPLGESDIPRPMTFSSSVTSLYNISLQLSSFCCLYCVDSDSAESSHDEPQYNKGSLIPLPAAVVILQLTLYVTYFHISRR